MSRYKGPTETCNTCGAQKPPYSVGLYPDERLYCLQRDGVGGICYRNREHGPKARGEAFAEAAV